MQGFQAKTVTAVRSQHVVCVVRVSELRAKAFQIGFDKDGSLFIHFPYFQHRTGILSSSEIPATGERKADVNIEHGGKVTSHRVKYSHHPDGRAHLSYDRGTGSLHEDVGALRRERILRVGQGVRKKGRGKQESAQPEMIVVVEQWICLVLGLVCMGFGMWGICMKPEQDALSAHIAWLGSLYTPTLRVTAVVCIGLGVVLARRGWAHL